MGLRVAWRWELGGRVEGGVAVGVRDGVEGGAAVGVRDGVEGGVAVGVRGWG